jgi:hypothetical protein
MFVECTHSSRRKRSPCPRLRRCRGTCSCRTARGRRSRRRPDRNSCQAADMYAVCRFRRPAPGWCRRRRRWANRHRHRFGGTCRCRRRRGRRSRRRRIRSSDPTDRFGAACTAGQRRRSVCPVRRRPLRPGTLLRNRGLPRNHHQRGRSSCPGPGTSLGRTHCRHRRSRFRRRSDSVVRRHRRWRGFGTRRNPSSRPRIRRVGGRTRCRAHATRRRSTGRTRHHRRRHHHICSGLRRRRKPVLGIRRNR